MGNQYLRTRTGSSPATLDSGTPRKSSISPWLRGKLRGLKLPPSPAFPPNPVRAPAGSGESYLAELAALGAELAQTAPGSVAFFAGPLRIVQKAMGFTLSVVYRVGAVHEDTLVLQVVAVLDPASRRPELAPGARIGIDLRRPDEIFQNEAAAFETRSVAAVNVPGVGCDIAGYVSAGEAATDAYLLGGDFVGAESAVQQADVRVFTIATGLLSALLTKAHYQQRADHDRLTGVLSSARIRAQLDECLVRGGRMLTVVLADLDLFKQINDRHGHLQGDAVLAGVARVIAAALRGGRDYVGRYGGEEFLLILDNTGHAEAWEVLERVRRSVEAQGATGIGSGEKSAAAVAVTISIGACLVPSHRPTLAAAEVLAAADRALYAAKLAGRNRVVIATADGST